MGSAVGRWGGRLPTVAGTAIAAGGLVAAAFAPSFALFVLGLLVAGVGAAAVPIASMGAVFTTFAPQRRA
jgi:MFS family permease